MSVEACNETSACITPDAGAHLDCLDMHVRELSDRVHWVLQACWYIYWLLVALKLAGCAM